MSYCIDMYAAVIVKILQTTSLVHQKADFNLYFLVTFTYGRGHEDVENHQKEVRDE